MEYHVLIFTIGIALNAVVGLPEKLLNRLKSFKTIFYVLAGFLGTVLVTYEIAYFLINNQYPLSWFYLPFVITVGVWFVRSYCNRNDATGKLQALYYAFLISAGVEIAIFVVYVTSSIWSNPW